MPHGGSNEQYLWTLRRQSARSSSPLIILVSSLSVLWILRSIDNPFNSVPIQATISSDNFLRIYECLEQPVLTSWQLAEEIDMLSLPPTQGSPSSTVPLATPAQAVTSLENTPPIPGHSLQSQQSLTRIGSGPHREADGGWCLSWCKERYWGEILAVSAGTTGTVHVRRRPLGCGFFA